MYIDFCYQALNTKLYLKLQIAYMALFIVYINSWSIYISNGSILDETKKNCFFGKKKLSIFSALAKSVYRQARYKITI